MDERSDSEVEAVNWEGEVKVSEFPEATDVDYTAASTEVSKKCQGSTEWPSSSGMRLEQGDTSLAGDSMEQTDISDEDEESDMEEMTSKELPSSSSSSSSAPAPVGRSAAARRQKRKSLTLPQEVQAKRTRTSAEEHRKGDHNEKERKRRQELKEAVINLRKQLQKPTRKPSTISVLNAAQQEIKELNAVQERDEIRLEELKEQHSHLQWKLERLQGEMKQLPPPFSPTRLPQHMVEGGSVPLSAPAPPAFIMRNPTLLLPPQPPSHLPLPPHSISPSSLFNIRMPNRSFPPYHPLINPCIPPPPLTTMGSSVGAGLSNLHLQGVLPEYIYPPISTLIRAPPPPPSLSPVRLPGFLGGNPFSFPYLPGTGGSAGASCPQTQALLFPGGFCPPTTGLPLASQEPAFPIQVFSHPPTSTNPTIPISTCSSSLPSPPSVIFSHAPSLSYSNSDSSISLQNLIATSAANSSGIHLDTAGGTESYQSNVEVSPSGDSSTDPSPTSALEIIVVDEDDEESSGELEVTTTESAILPPGATDEEKLEQYLDFGGRKNRRRTFRNNSSDSESEGSRFHSPASRRRTKSQKCPPDSASGNSNSKSREGKSQSKQCVGNTTKRSLPPLLKVDDPERISNGEIIMNLSSNYDVSHTDLKPGSSQADSPLTLCPNLAYQPLKVREEESSFPEQQQQHRSHDQEGVAKWPWMDEIIRKSLTSFEQKIAADFLTCC